MRRWLITGVSGGLGAALAAHVLDAGDRVSGTTRDAGAAAAFSARAGAFGLVGNIADAGEAARLIGAAVEALGGLDILVNNAGYGLAGAVEAVSDAEARAQFDANLFGPLAMIRSALPHLRASSAGRIINVSSMAAVESYAGLGLYNASKAALSALSDALDQEIADTGVRAIAVEPGGIRTHFAGASLQRAESALPLYAVRDAAQREAFARSDGNQTGDPVRMAAALYALATMSDPPRRLTLGPGTIARADAALTARLETYRRYGALSAATGFDD
jgi:NAD(P)-dependent dehydrogenase (short-subunit alcohol dehydrogenase family)